MDKSVAQEISVLMLEYGAKLNESIKLVMAHGTQEEIDGYRRAVGRIMTDMLLYIMDPIYEEHPELEPPQLRTDRPQRHGKGSP